MSLVFCPECSHEISANAIACPNCGRPISPAPVVERKVVAVMPPRRESGVPPWAIVAIGVVGIILLFVAYMAFRSSDDQGNLNINVNSAGRHTTQVPASDSTTVTVPSSSDTAPGTTTTVPGTATTVPVAPLPDKGTVVINAKIVQPRGAPQAVRNAKFYLLDKDLETILSEARIEPIEGNSLTGSLGLAVVYPDRYGDFWRAAMRAISGHAKYSGTTSGDGSANLAGIVPNEYYLFGITRVGRGFVLWNAPVSIIAGQNVMNLSPQSVTEIPES